MSRDLFPGITALEEGGNNSPSLMQRDGDESRNPASQTLGSFNQLQAMSTTTSESSDYLNLQQSPMPSVPQPVSSQTSSSQHSSTSGNCSPKTLKALRKQRKNDREKKRRLEINEKMEKLANILGLASEKAKTEKYNVLAEAAKVINQLRSRNSELRNEKSELRSELSSLTRCLQDAFPHNNSHHHHNNQKNSTSSTFNSNQSNNFDKTPSHHLQFPTPPSQSQRCPVSTPFRAPERKTFSSPNTPHAIPPFSSPFHDNNNNNNIPRTPQPRNLHESSMNLTGSPHLTPSKSELFSEWNSWRREDEALKDGSSHGNSGRKEERKLSVESNDDWLFHDDFGGEKVELGLPIDSFPTSPPAVPKGLDLNFAVD
mmetsp:Transcript_6058/g.8404  ORF Transcript_6058/g.8404 Transcript_6058/m.8404 type:complete len:371 (+) Transcript_6058:218-1330(+)|eukprot:CAMPEP_0184481844 /NCGR_PEP_ID=MMETSP0113_2-20130426/3435_1 /TAXON_ID=91329 /ORGANISM="Norrisiella sphaerica, Strain BC52" /LENGTH=370 /DNA_ID=CAMNT_0026861247 /DNA_START=154 /DNA_END=1266 /DNA_ORIENTATION=+